MFKKFTAWLKAFPRRGLWMVILFAALYVSGWSLFEVARHLGVPLYVAVCGSACFDGVALLAGVYSLQAVREHRNDAWPRIIVVIYTIVSAYINTLHARIDHEVAGAWLFWAALPVSAAVAYSIASQAARQKALAVDGKRYPSRLPSWGTATWLLEPLKTLSDFQEIVRERRIALSKAAKDFLLDKRPIRATIKGAALPATEPIEPNSDPAPANAPLVPPANAPMPETPRSAAATPANGRPANVARVFGSATSDEVRVWAKSNGFNVRDIGRMSVEIYTAYYAEHPNQAFGGRPMSDEAMGE
jgi:Protein of unknown function (DUF2637)